MAYTTINDPTIYFNTVLYTGDGNNGRTVTGVGFQPDWVWAKERSSSSSHKLSDSVRGATKELESNNNGAEGTNSSGLQSFDSDGFTVGTSVAWNESSQTMVAWNWKAGGSASSNSNGTITSSVSANTTAGFSVVKWTGDNNSTATIGHSLGSTPSIVIVKRIDATDNWYVYSKPVGNTSVLNLDTTSASAASVNYWNNTDPTTTVFTVGDSFRTTGSFIAYCFAEKQGYSQFGSYTGNGNSNGPYIHTGGKPAWVMIKRTNASGDAWVIFDNKRPGYNLTDNFLEADASGSEAVDNPNQRLDMLSNGFKIRGTGSATNTSGSTYLYMAFAENPFVNSNGVPNNGV